MKMMMKTRKTTNFPSSFHATTKDPPVRSRCVFATSMRRRREPEHPSGEREDEERLRPKSRTQKRVMPWHGARAHGDLKRQADARPAHPPSCITRLAMAITDLFEDSSSNRHDGVYLAYYFLGTSLHYITSGELKRLRKAKHVAKT